MPAVFPYFYLLILAFLAAPIAVLAMLPAYPKNNAIKSTWLLLFVLAFSEFAWSTWLTPANSLIFWHPPTWYPLFEGMLKVVLPFAASFVLWRIRLRSPSTIGPRTAFIAVTVICLLALAALIFFNETCVYYDYHHDQGTAWCPASWQANDRL